MIGAEFAAAAEALVGARFRLRGRDPATGLDCVGLIEAALAATGTEVSLPIGYALKMRRVEGLPGLAKDLGYAEAAGAPQPGDVLLFQIAPAQFHFAIRTAEGFVHAHAGLGRVVLSPRLPDWLVVGHWRPTDEPATVLTRG